MCDCVCDCVCVIVCVCVHLCGHNLSSAVSAQDRQKERDNSTGRRDANAYACMHTALPLQLSVCVQGWAGNDGSDK